MKKIFLNVIVLLFFYSCSSRNEFRITGKLDNGVGKRIILQDMNSNRIVPIDSVKLDKDGSFSFHQKMSEPGFYSLQISKYDFITLIIKPGEKIKITGDANYLYPTYEVEGSPESARLKEISHLLSIGKQRVDSLGKIFYQYKDSIGVEVLKNRLDSAFRMIKTEIRNKVLTIIENNMGNLISLWAVYQELVPRHYLFDWHEDLNLFTRVDSCLQIKYAHLILVKTLHKQVEEAKIYVAQQQKRAASVSIGSEAPEISLPSPDGKVINLSSLRGKYVLLDFWASWCSPCRTENFSLVEIYEKYHHKGFEIFQVSLDKTKQAWVNAIEDDNLKNWIHVSDLKFWNSIVVPVYNINSIPANFLLDKEGKIIAINLRGNQLEKKLKEILH